MTNEKGSAIIAALMILVLLSIMGIASINLSTTELNISTNYQIAEMNFYAAESGAPHGVLWLKNFDLVNDTSTDWFGPTTTENVLDEDGNIIDTTDVDEWFNLSNQTSYTWQVKHRLDTDGNILYYGDTNNDYLWEINTTTGIPLETILSKGTHPRGGISKIETTWIFQEPFPMPQAALFGHALIEKNGGSGAIWGEDQSGSGCSNAMDIATDGIDLDNVDVKDIVLDGGDGVDIQYGQPLYPIPLIREVLLKKHPEEMIGTVDTDDSFEGILFVHPDAYGNIDAQKLTGKGILFIDGNLDVNGGIGWEGMVIINGEVKVNGGGGLNVSGAVAAFGDITLNGSVSIKYDCEKISDIFDKYSGYRMTSWKQM
jgi:hypothetical protein